MIRVALLACLALGGCAPLALYGVPVRLSVRLEAPRRHMHRPPDRVRSTLPAVFNGTL